MNDPTAAPPALPDSLAARLAEALECGAELPPPALRARLLARARRSPPPGLRTVRADEGDWRPLLPRVYLKPLAREGDTLTYLLRLDPGGTIPPHEHPQDEECIVLAGEVSMGELVLRAGDYHLAPRGVPHGALQSGTGALLFLRGAVPALG